MVENQKRDFSLSLEEEEEKKKNNKKKKRGEEMSRFIYFYCEKAVFLYQAGSAMARLSGTCSSSTPGH